MKRKTLREQMLDLCKSAGFEPTKNFDKIVAAKERFGIGLHCPCDKNNPDRYCISYQCALDTIRDGHCHCNCYKVPDKKGGNEK